MYKKARRITEYGENALYYNYFDLQHQYNQSIKLNRRQFWSITDLKKMRFEWNKILILTSQEIF